jgi:hypothetical protein
LTKRTDAQAKEDVAIFDYVNTNIDTTLIADETAGY